MESIWIEKYRPKRLDDLVGNKAACEILVKQLGNLQHLLLTGPPGVGKTSALHCLAYELLGPEKYAHACLELNAGDERGIDVVRQRIKLFVVSHVELSPGQFKICILDEVEAMTESAQQALRRLMEEYKDTRFLLACNQSEKVIDPVQSRCLRIGFTRVSSEVLIETMKNICTKENVSYDQDALEEIASAAEGDLRKAIGSLQAAAVAFKKVAIPSVYHACDIPPTARLNAIFENLRKAHWRDAHNQYARTRVCNHLVLIPSPLPISWLTASDSSFRTMDLVHLGYSGVEILSNSILV